MPDTPTRIVARAAAAVAGAAIVAACAASTPSSTDPAPAAPSWHRPTAAQVATVTARLTETHPDLIAGRALAAVARDIENTCLDLATKTEAEVAAATAGRWSRSAAPLDPATAASVLGIARTACQS